MGTKQSFAAALIAFAGAIFGRETVIWAWNKALDALAGSFSWAGAAVNVPAFPWIDTFGILLLLAGLWLFVASRKAKPTLKAAGVESALSPQTQAPTFIEATPPNEPKPARYLEAAVVCGGAGTLLPEYRARFGRSGSGAMFAIEYSAHFGGMFGDSGWAPPRKVNVQYRDRFTRGEAVTFSIVRPEMTDDGMRWFVGHPGSPDERFPSEAVPGNAHMRGRVTLHVGEAVEEHCYFIMHTMAGPHDMPDVVGEHMFEHTYLWEGKEPPNGDSGSLFR